MSPSLPSSVLPPSLPSFLPSFLISSLACPPTADSLPQSRHRQSNPVRCAIRGELLGLLLAVHTLARTLVRWGNSSADGEDPEKRVGLGGNTVTTTIIRENINLPQLPAAVSHRALPRPFGCLPLFGLYNCRTISFVDGFSSRGRPRSIKWPQEKSSKTEKRSKEEEKALGCINQSTRGTLSSLPN